jgi:hypothetical protein
MGRAGTKPRDRLDWFGVQRVEKELGHCALGSWVAWMEVDPKHFRPVQKKIK